MQTNPLILTLKLNKQAFEFFTDLRDKHFPPERNFLKAHLTLFHQLPKNNVTITDCLEAISQKYKPIPLDVVAPKSIGNGVAYPIESGELQHLHHYLQQQWQAYLIPQDKQKLRPHITVQNKVKPEVAKQLETSLKQGFTPFRITGTGFMLWEYKEGPWELLKSFDFQA